MAEVGGHTANPKRKSRKFDEFLDELRADDPKFAAEYDKLGPRFAAISQLITADLVPEHLYGCGEEIAP